MTQHYRSGLNFLFSLLIIIWASTIISEFFIPLIWAGIIAIATWPIYLRWLRVCSFHHIFAAITITLFITCITGIPLLWITKMLASEVQSFSKFLLNAHSYGASFPEWMNRLPSLLSNSAHTFWDQTLGKPHGLIEWLQRSIYSFSSPLTSLFRTIGEEIFHRSLSFAFAILSLFFFYKDGAALTQEIKSVGDFCLGERWSRYLTVIPAAIAATVNGVVFVGIAVGVLMGLSYAYVGVPTPILFGIITAFLAMIPFAVPFVFAVVALLLVIQDQMLAALMITILGTSLMFVVDHFIRPYIIGGAARLPFLAVLFGILGGVKTFGIVGLFLGPVAMAFFMTLWHEPELFKKNALSC